MTALASIFHKECENYTFLYFIELLPNFYRIIASIPGPNESMLLEWSPVQHKIAYNTAVTMVVHISGLELIKDSIYPSCGVPIVCIFTENWPHYVETVSVGLYENTAGLVKMQGSFYVCTQPMRGDVTM